MLQPNIKKVSPTADYKIILEYTNGEKRIFDMTNLLKHPFYSVLSDKNVFNTVHTVDGGWTVEWSGGRDISPHELYERSVPVN